MTLVVAVIGKETIWLVADRRLSVKGRQPKDDACKIINLSTTDGEAILGYAGLGATGVGTEPSEWMSATLRGRNLPLEQSLGVLADIARRQLPRHMTRMPGQGGPVHSMIIPAFVGDEPRLYSIDMVFAPDRKSFRFRYTRHVVRYPAADTPRMPRLGIGGTGAIPLNKNRIKDKSWKRNLLRMVRANECGQLSAEAVADHLATLNQQVHDVCDSVGPRCIVVWRFRKGGMYVGGGGHRFYTGPTWDSGTAPIPTIANGRDIAAFADVLLDHAMKSMEAGESKPDLDSDKINELLSRLPDKPDEKLR